MKIVLVGKNAFHQAISGIKEKCSHTEDPHLQKDPERTGVVQILGKVVVNDNQCEKPRSGSSKFFVKCSSWKCSGPEELT